MKHVRDIYARSVSLIIGGEFEYFMEGKQVDQDLEQKAGLESAHG